MALPTLNYTTGPATLADDPNNPVAGVSGTLVYNGCTFSPLVDTKVSGKCVQDNAKRTVKIMEYSITVDGYVTFTPGVAVSIAPTMQTLYQLLTKEGGALKYIGRGLDIDISADQEWGPVPELLEFQPLGGSASAKIMWKVTVRLVPESIRNIKNSLGLLQLNYDTSVRYGDDGYSSFSIKGTMEIPLNYLSTKLGALSQTVDQRRGILEDKILQGIDLGRFHLTNRVFNISRDKRTMEFDVAGEEKPYMDIPPDCTLARFVYLQTVQAWSGYNEVGLHTPSHIYRGAWRQQARSWDAFASLMNLRMQQTELTPSPGDFDKDRPQRPGGKVLSRKAMLVNLTATEGMYLDSKTISFSASWWQMCTFSQIILASGLWRKVPEGINGKTSDRVVTTNLWAQSMLVGRTPTKESKSTSIMGAYSWLPQTIDPSLDVIVDFGTTGL